MSQIKIELPQPYYDILKKRAEDNYQSLRAYATNVLARFCSDKLIDFSNPETIPDYVTIKIDTKALKPKTDTEATPSLPPIDPTTHTRSKREVTRFIKDRAPTYLGREIKSNEELDDFINYSMKNSSVPEAYDYDYILSEMVRIKKIEDERNKPAPPAFLEEVNTIQEKIFNTINNNYYSTSHNYDKDELISIFNKIKDYCVKNDCLENFYCTIEYPTPYIVPEDDQQDYDIIRQPAI